jgi:hypothetical protein
MRLGKVTADETAAVISVESRTANNIVGWEIKTRSVIITAREGSLDTSFRPMFERSTVSAMIHDVDQNGTEDANWGKATYSNFGPWQHCWLFLIVNIIPS